MKRKAWGVEQAIWGSDHHAFYWFGSKEAREEYMKKHDYCDRIRCRTIETGNQNEGGSSNFVQFFEAYKEFEKAMKERW